MISRRFLLLATPALGWLTTMQPALAKNPHHHDGHQLLGNKLKQNGKHVVGKAGRYDAVAEVANGKVTNMTAGNLPAKKVRSTRKMAGLGGLAVPVSQQFTQVDYWYAYCFEDGPDEYCYWYPATDVVVTDGWVDYIPA